ncbi:MAG: hypothetical protein KA275_07220 [Chitinophagaceae bacterium]|nr:hypothetical protein [Chitinophagaceae bacterium]
MPNCNWLVISDPYIFENDNDLSFFKNLLKKMYRDESTIPTTFILEYSNPKTKDLKTKFEGLEKEFPNFSFTLKERYEKFIHDRNIFTNSFWLSCDYGFKNQYSNDTKWHQMPIGKYYYQMHLLSKRFH